MSARRSVRCRADVRKVIVKRQDFRDKYFPMSATEAPLSPRALPPRRAPLLSPCAWLVSRPRVQAVICHPKVQWAMTNLGIRRWRAIRRWPPLLLAAAGLGTITDDLHVPRWEHDLAGLALYIGLMVTALSADAYLARRARRLAGPRARASYLAMGAGLVPLAVGCFAAASRLDAHGNPSLADAVGFIGLLGCWAALLALGRALAWGRLRRICWIYPPAGRRPAGTRDVTGGSGLR
jgi:hypothetical protein